MKTATFAISASVMSRRGWILPYLLTYSGCTTDADVAIQIFGGSQRENITPVHLEAVR